MKLIALEISTRFTDGGREHPRFAFVGYRDYWDTVKIEVQDFTTDLAVFQSFVSKLHAGGGDDVCEDLYSGLEELANLSWSPPGWFSSVICYICQIFTLSERSGVF